LLLDEGGEGGAHLFIVPLVFVLSWHGLIEGNNREIIQLISASREQRTMSQHISRSLLSRSSTDEIGE
jgi:hypothetical protein